MKIINFFRSPIKASIFSLILWIIVYIIPTHKYTVDITTQGVFILALYFVCFIVGALFIEIVYRIRSEKDSLIDKEKTEENNSINNTKYNPKWLNCTLVLGSIGMLLKFYDLIVRKDFLLYEGAADFKSNYSGGDFGAINLISAILFPMVLITFIAFINNKKSFNKKQIIWNCTNFVLLILYSILLGARTQITLVIMAVVSVLAKNYSKGIKVKKSKSKNFKIIVGLVVVGAIFFIYSVNILSDRLQYQNKGTEYALIYLEDMHHVKVSDSVWEAVYKGNMSGDLLYTIISLRHYFVHGIYQFQVLVDTYPLDSVAWGQWEYNAIFKALSLFGVPYKSVQDIQVNMTDYGVYSSFFGDVYIDFGLYGWIYMLILGVIVQIIYKKSFKKEQDNIMYALIYSIITHMFFINMICYAMGLYYILSFILGLYILPKFIKGGIQCEE